MISFGPKSGMMHICRRWVRRTGLRLVGCYAVRCIGVLGYAALVQGSTRIVAVGGAVTDIGYRLGAGHQLVGVDASSIYPQAATKLPQAGYQRMRSVEGVLSINPTLVLLSVEARPPDAVTLCPPASDRDLHPECSGLVDRNRNRVALER